MRLAVAPSTAGGSFLLARLIAAAAFVAFVPGSAGATTPFADYCEGNICFQRKVQMGCLKPEARRLMRTIAERFGKIEVASACDGRHARRSAHYVGKAFDFRPFGASRAEIVAYLKASPEAGSVGTYPNGLIHADVGDRKMTWYGHGGRAWPIGIDRAFANDAPAPSSLASAAPNGGLAAAFAAAFAPAAPLAAAPAPAGDAQTAPAQIAKIGASRIPLPPARPAVLLASTDDAAAAPAPGPTDFVLVLRGPLAPVAPELLGEVAAAEDNLPTFFSDHPARVGMSRMPALAMMTAEAN